MKSGTLEGFFPISLKKLISMNLSPLSFFHSGRWKITPLSLKTLKEYLKNLKCPVLLMCYSGNP